MVLTMLMVEPDYLRALVGQTEDDRWRDIALNWLLASIVVAVACAGIMVLIKWLTKMRAQNPMDRVWRQGKTLGFIFAGLAPVLLFMIVVWFLTRDFVNVVQVGGLLKGVLLGWLIYLVLIFLVHVGPWRYDLK